MLLEENVVAGIEVLNNFSMIHIKFIKEHFYEDEEREV
jgi:hypothetical protein